MDHEKAIRIAQFVDLRPQDVINKIGYYRELDSLNDLDSLKELLTRVPKDRVVSKLVMEKIMAKGIETLGSINNFDEAVRFYADNSQIEALAELAAEKIFSLASNIEQFRMAYVSAPIGSELAERSVYEFEKIGRRMLQESTNKEDALAIYRIAIADSRLEAEALDKIASFFETPTPSIIG